MAGAFQRSAFQDNAFQIDAVVLSLSRPIAIQRHFARGKPQYGDIEYAKALRQRVEEKRKVKRELELALDDEEIVVALFQSGLI